MQDATARAAPMALPYSHAFAAPEPASRTVPVAGTQCRPDAQLMEQAVFGLARRFPGLSAQQVLTRPQAVIGVLLVAALMVAFLLWPVRAWHGLVVALSLVFGINSVFRALLALAAPRRPARVDPCPDELPSYTILVPLYREAAVLPALVDSLLKLDYPRALLDIKLVVEADDTETVAAARALARRHGVLEVIAVPVGGPRTKPNSWGDFLSAIPEGVETLGFAWISERLWPPAPPPDPFGGLAFGR